MPSANGVLTAAGLELAYFSGLARLFERRAGGTGVILRFERVRPEQAGRFQPLRAHDIAPEFLDRLVRALRRWKFDLVSLDEMCARTRRPTAPGRFAALTFDGGYRDVLTHGYPVLAKHDVPFAVYIPTAFPDGVGEAWWLALPEIVARHDRISLVMDGQEQHFNAADIAAKHELYDFLANWMQTLAPAALSAAVNDLCRRYSVDLAALSRDAFMTWQDVEKLATDSRITIGSATVNYPVLAALPDDAARRDIEMGKAVTEAVTGREVRHFAYPFGHPGSFDARHGLMAEQAGFVSAVSNVSGVIRPDGRSELYALPRVGWNAQRSLRTLRVRLSGLRLGR
ncbi:MAG: polysaccharide deacetylase family protein [Rhizobiales bacterium]|nr:polysaccharide deacetylase family protein [Hyphomicrobiales bacterium]